MPSKDDDEQGRFAEYFAARRDTVRRTAYLLCGDWHWADDLTQIAFTKLAAGWNRVRDPQALDAYVRTCLARAYFADLRRVWRRRERSTADVPDSVTPDDSAESVARRMVFTTALRRLPPRQRAVLVYRYYQGLDVTATAEALRCSEGTITPNRNPVVLGVDPRTGVARPLANQPPFQVIESGDAIQTGAIVVYGPMSDIDPQRYAISRDGGRTWSAHTLPTVERSTMPLVYTTDGVHLYAISDRNADRIIRYLVSDDGGGTWSPQRTVTGDMVVGWIVLRDGGVVLATADGPRTSFWITHDGGAHFEPFTGMHGLPASASVRITRNGDGSYLARPNDGSRTFYLSRDGVNWQQVRIR